MLKQVILIREDLKLPRGLLAAQVAHIHMESFRQVMLAGLHKKNGKSVSLQDELGDGTIHEWLKTPYIFIHGVPNLEALHFFMDEAGEKDLDVAAWSDTIYLEFSPNFKRAFPNILVGAAIGPAESDVIKSVIGDLPLLA